MTIQKMYNPLTNFVRSAYLFAIAKKKHYMRMRDHCAMCTRRTPDAHACVGHARVHSTRVHSGERVLPFGYMSLFFTHNCKTVSFLYTCVASNLAQANNSLISRKSLIINNLYPKI